MELSALVPTAAHLVDLEALAVRVARACGDLVRDERPARLGVAHTKSSATDVVTVMDERSERLAAELLAVARPDDGQFGEEGLRAGGAGPVTWVVDPIDGTVNYLYGIPAYAVSVAAVVGDPSTDGGWLPVAGAVVNPETGECFSARRGGGARRAVDGDVVELACSPADTLAQTMLGTGFAYEADVRREQGAVVARLLPLVRDIRRIGSAALDLCHVADGALDAYYERGLKPWDMAAGWLVATEAGAAVRGLPGAQPGRAMVMAGAPAVLDELAPLLADD